MPRWNTYFLSSFQSLSVLIVTCLVVLSSCTGFVILFVFLSFFSSSFYFLLLTNLVHLMLSFCFSVALCAARAARTPRPSFLFSFALVRHLANRTSSSLFLPFSSFLLYFLFCFPWLSFILFHCLRYNLPLPLSARAIRAERKCQPFWLIFLSRRSDPFFVLLLYYRLRIHNFP